MFFHPKNRKFEICTFFHVFLCISTRKLDWRSQICRKYDSLLFIWLESVQIGFLQSVFYFEILHGFARFRQVRVDFTSSRHLYASIKVIKRPCNLVFFHPKNRKFENRNFFHVFLCIWTRKLDWRSQIFRNYDSLIFIILESF